MSPRLSRRIDYVPGLDGLRGTAVAGVLLFHASALLRGGYLGVDLFFVLSGYLITALLLREHDETGRIDLRAFWVRRFRRLMPALLALVPAIALYARFLAEPSALASLRADALATLAYVANWRAIVAKRSYWEMFAAPSPLEHTWSLAIEEQFYLVWPLIVAGVLRWGRRALVVVVGVLAVASALTMLLLYEEGRTMRVYLGTDARGAAILVGAALALSGVRRVPGWLGVVALAVLAFAWGFLDGQSELLYRGGFWITEVACAVLIAACVSGEGVARIFAWRPLRLLGTISYGVYLWHWPVYVVLSEERVRLGFPALLALRLALTFVIALASYRWLERPIRERGVGRPALVVPAAVGACVLFVLVATRPVAASAPPALVAEMPLPPEPKAAALAPHAPVAMNLIPPASELPPDTLRVLVVGDSVGLALGARMRWAQDSGHAFVAQRAVGDCSILDGYAPVFSMSGEPHGNGNCAADWVSDARELEPDVVAIVIGGAYFSRVKVDGRSRGVCHPGWGGPYRERLATLLGEIAPHARRRVVVLAAYPVGKWQTPTRNGDVDCYNRILRDAASDAGADVIDLNAYACPGGKCTMKSREAAVRPDGLHFDGLGAEDTARWVLAQLRVLP